MSADAVAALRDMADRIDAWPPDSMVTVGVISALVRERADDVAAEADASQADRDEAWRHNAKLHNDMRRRIQQVATHAAAEQRTLSWVADELTDILDDPQAWRGETTSQTIAAADASALDRYIGELATFVDRLRATGWSPP